MGRLWRAKPYLVLSGVALTSLLVISVASLALNALSGIGNPQPQVSYPVSTDSGSDVDFGSTTPAVSAPAAPETPTAPSSDAGNIGNVNGDSQKSNGDACSALFNQITSEINSVSQASNAANTAYNLFIQSHTQDELSTNPALAAEAQRLGDASIAATAAVNQVRDKYPYQSFGCSGGVFVTTPW